MISITAVILYSDCDEEDVVNVLFDKQAKTFDAHALCNLRFPLNEFCFHCCRSRHRQQAAGRGKGFLVAGQRPQM